MSIICAIIVTWASRCLVTRLAHAHCSLSLPRTIGYLVNILVYGRPYCIKCRFVNFRHLWLDVNDDCRSPTGFQERQSKDRPELQSRGNDSEQLLGWRNHRLYEGILWVPTVIQGYF